MSALDRDVAGTLAAVAPAISRAAEQLPPLISVTVNSSGVVLSPWLAGAPLQALLAWSEQLTGAEWHMTRVQGTTAVSVIGELDGIRVEVATYTHRTIIRRPDLSVSEADVRFVAADEVALGSGVNA